MTSHNLLKARLALTERNLSQVLDRLSDADLPWAPKEGMRTVGGQLLEIASKELELVAWLKTGEWPEDEDNAFDLSTATVASIRETLRELRAATHSYIDSFTEAQLEELIPCPERWWEALLLTECPRSEIIRNISAHEWYHTGQLISYLWMRGDDPYDW